MEAQVPSLGAGHAVGTAETGLHAALHAALQPKHGHGVQGDELLQRAKGPGP